MNKPERSWSQIDFWLALFALWILLITPLWLWWSLQ